MTPQEIKRIPRAIATGEGTWVCPEHRTVVVFRDGGEGLPVPVIPLKDRISRGSFTNGDARDVQVLDWRAGARRQVLDVNVRVLVPAPLRPQPIRPLTSLLRSGRSRGWLVSRCAPGGCRVKVRP